MTTETTTRTFRWRLGRHTLRASLAVLDDDGVTTALLADESRALADEYETLEAAEREAHERMRAVLTFAGMACRCRCGTWGWQLRRFGSGSTQVFTEEGIAHDCGDAS